MDLYFYLLCLLCCYSLGPLLQGFELDKNYGKIVMLFDQEVEAASFNISKLTLQAVPDITTEIFTFQDMAFNNLTEQGNTSSLFFYMSKDDFARLALE